jgi:hypothetical protein
MFCVGSLSAQNLIQNGDFQDTIIGNFGLLKAKYWDVPTSSSPDLMHPNSIEPWRVPQNLLGYQNAKSAEAYYGLIVYDSSRTNAREYIRNELKSTLKKDSSYCLQFYLSLADSMNFAIKNNVGIYFMNQKIDSPNVRHALLHYIPQIEFNEIDFFAEKNYWVKMNDSLIAKGGEKYLLIGNFKEDQFLDTMRMMGGNDIGHKGTYYYFDNFYLGHCDSLPEDSAIGIREFDIKKHKISIYPNPTKSNITINYPIQGNQAVYFELYDVLGKKQMEQQLKAGKLHQLSLSQMRRGIYLYRLKHNGNIEQSGKLVVE